MSKKAKMPNNDWHDFFVRECSKEYFRELNSKLGEEYRNFIVYPPVDLVFNAFDKTPYSDVKVVILGQDPYHEPKQAMGMCFSVPEDVKVPPSLVNIKKEIKDDIDIKLSSSGDLTHWAKQGVLLLNATLTVREAQANSHSNLGWQIFTDDVISYVNEKENPVVFILWGGFARSKKNLITNKQHLILESAHPSPLSAHRGFFGCKHFSKCNDFLNQNGMESIDWSI